MPDESPDQLHDATPSSAANRLAQESSPYLRQHAHNPVDWYPWGPEALEKARRENKPILLSVGYSACHWCHVMAHESFEQPATAAVMNRYFVNVKVDREERPDVDEVYQRVTQLISGQGGWPLTVFLAPDLRPIYGGTYFPPTPKYGRPSFTQLLEGIAKAWRSRPDEADQSAAQLVDHMRRWDEVAGESTLPSRALLGDVVRQLAANFDSTWGGFGTAPKFPMVADQLALLAGYEATGDRQALDMVLFTLDRMAAGGLYDQLGGGFHRYSVDPYWLAPHFEKMLYDNALIPRLYLEAVRLTGDAGWGRIVRETVAYLFREMRDPQGGFYATQDADSEGIEGKFFTWSLSELREALGAERGERFAAVYGATEDGNWEHTNILHVARRAREVAAEAGMTPEALEAELAEGRDLLFRRREGRVHPGRDDKILAGWNGLTMSLLAHGAVRLAEPAWREAARAQADFILGHMRPQGMLKRVYQDGKAKIDAFLDDYAYLTAGLLDLHRADGDPQWLTSARSLMAEVLVRFQADGLFYLTPADGESLPVRPVSSHDQMLPSPAGVAVHACWRLFVLTGEPRFREAVEAALRRYRAGMEKQPTAHAGLLLALDAYERGETTCVIAGDPADPRTRELAGAARRLLRDDETVLFAERPEGLAPHLIEGKRPLDGAPAAYVCRGMACLPAAATGEELAERLR